MLKFLSIQNFQSHKDTSLEFAPGVNIIVGPSNSGKTAILRALNWLLKNRPLGDGFIHWGEQQANVHLVVGNCGQDVIVARDRSKSKNVYVLNTNGKELKFTAFGNNPPQEVIDSLNIGDINIQSQFNPYFLVFDSPGTIASYIRSVTGLEKLDIVSDLLSSRVRKAKITVSDRGGELQVVSGQLQEIEKIDLEGLRSLLQNSEEMLQKLDELSENKAKLTVLVQQISQLESQRLVLPEKRLSEILSEKKRISQDYLRLLENQRRLSSILVALNGLESAITLPEELEDILSNATFLRKEYNDKCLKLQRLFGLVGQILKADVELENLSGEVVFVDGEVKELRNQLTVCPSCGSILTEETKLNLLQSRR